MLTSPLPYVFDVVSPILHPVAARVGDVIVVRVGAPVALAVVRSVRGAWQVVRVGPPNYGALLIPLTDGAIVARDEAARRLLLTA